MPLPAVTQNRLMGDLKAQITSGELPAGARLPARLDLCATYGMSSVTVQKAVRRLVAEGFLVTRARGGTFVAPRLQHLDSLALVYPVAPAKVGSSPYFRSLEAAARMIEAQGTWRLPRYYHVYWEGDEAESERLRADIFGSRLAGAIYANLPSHLFARPWWPKVRLTQLAVSATDKASEIPILHLDYRSFCAAACQRLRAQGRRRVAALQLGARASFGQQLAAAATAHGLEHDPCWCQSATPESVQQCVSLLLSPRMRGRPDALIVADDTLLPGVLATLSSLPWQVPRELGLVTLANFPEPLAAPPFVQRVGFDQLALLETAIRLLTRATPTRPLPALTHFAARGE